MKDIIILYLDKFKKKFLVYKETELYDMELPLEYVDDGRNMYLGDLKEKWEIKEVKSTKNELTIKFKLVFRKT
jgi:phage-related protein